MTVRYLLARLHWVAYDSPLAIALRAEDEKDEKPAETSVGKPTVERLRQREQEIREQRTKEVAGG